MIRVACRIKINPLLLQVDDLKIIPSEYSGSDDLEISNHTFAGGQEQEVQEKEQVYELYSKEGNIQAFLVICVIFHSTRLFRRRTSA